MLGRLSHRNRCRTGSTSNRIITRGRRRVSVLAQSESEPLQGTETYRRLQGLQVLRSTDGSSVELVRQWDAPRGERAVVAWTRSLGCPFCQELAIQLRRDVKPRLDAMGVKLLMVSIGTPERSKDFVAKTGFPAENLFLDPDNVTYDAIGLKRNIQDTFFNIATPLSLARRAMSNQTSDLQYVADGWQPWMTPKGFYQALQQGGLFVFQGEQLAFSHFDQATGVHADIEEALAVARSLTPPSTGPDCGCAAGPAGDTAAA